MPLPLVGVRNECSLVEKNVPDMKPSTVLVFAMSVTRWANRSLTLTILRALDSFIASLWLNVSVSSAIWALFTSWNETSLVRTVMGCDSHSHAELGSIRTLLTKPSFRSFFPIYSPFHIHLEFQLSVTPFRQFSLSSFAIDQLFPTNLLRNG